MPDIFENTATDTASQGQVQATAQNLAEALGVPDAVPAKEPEKKPEQEPVKEESQETVEAEPNETPEPKAETKPADKPAPAPVVAPEDEKVFSKAEASAMIADRNARDKKIQLVRKAEAILGKPLEEALPDLEKRMAQEIQDNEGVTETEAKERVSQSVELAELRRNQAELKAQQEQLARQATYNAAKRKYDAHSLVALARELESEIDAETNQGAIGDYDSALYFVVGRQMIAGDLYKRMEDKIRREVLASVGRRQGAGTEGSSTAAHEAEGPQLTAQQKQYANILGVPHKAYAEADKAINKSRGR